MKSDIKYEGKILSYNGCYGFISHNETNVFFHKSGLNNIYPCKNDIVTFNLKNSYKKKGKVEAYNINIKYYGEERGRSNKKIDLNNSDTQVGFVKWFNHEKGFGVIVNIIGEEYFWKDNTYVSFGIQTGSVIIFIGNDSSGKKIVKSCRLPQLLEDWRIIKLIPESKSNVTINTYCKINPYIYGGMGYKDITYNIQKVVSNQILKECNIQFFSDSKLLSDMIIYMVSNKEYIYLSLDKLKHIYKDSDEFNTLCKNLLVYIKEYNTSWGDEYLFDFIFKHKYLEFNSLEYNDQKIIIDKFITNKVISKNDNIKNSTLLISHENYDVVSNLINSINDNHQAMLYLLDKITPLLDIQSLFLAIYEDRLININVNSNLKDLILLKFTECFKNNKSSSKNYNFYRYNTEVIYTDNLKNRFFTLLSPDKKSNLSFFNSNTTYFNILKFILSDNCYTIEEKHALFKDIFFNLSYPSKQELLEDALIIEYLETIINDKYTLFSIKMQNNKKFISLVNKEIDNLSDKQKYILWKEGILSNLDNEEVINIAIKLGTEYLIESCKLLKKNDETIYWQLFDKIYTLFSSEQKAKLWLYGLSNKYDYPELIQSANFLSLEERKQLNKKIKAHAKQERFINFINQIPNAEVIEENGLNKVYKCKWRNLYYKDHSIIVFLNKETALPTYFWEPAKEEWNWLTNEYFSHKRISDIFVYTSNQVVINIIGLENIEERIIIADIQHNGSINHKYNLSNSQIVRIIHNISARNKCIDFLSRQESPYDTIDIQELVSNQYGDLRRDISFMFIIPNDNYAYIIWESVEYEKSKATYIFCCDRNSAKLSAENLKQFIESNLHTRSRLISTSTDENIRTQLNFYARINHDSQAYEIWEQRMKESLPFLK